MVAVAARAQRGTMAASADLVVELELADPACVRAPPLPRRASLRQRRRWWGQIEDEELDPGGGGHVPRQGWADPRRRWRRRRRSSPRWARRTCGWARRAYLGFSFFFCFLKHLLQRAFLGARRGKPINHSGQRCPLRRGRNLPRPCCGDGHPCPLRERKMTAAVKDFFK